MNEHDRLTIHSSEESNWRTPIDCFGALDREFDFGCDLAADPESCLVVNHTILGSKPAFLGPGSAVAENALIVDWPDRRPNFLNPPFSKTRMNAYRTGRIKDKATDQWIEHPIDAEQARVYDIGEWAKKCWEQSQRGCTIVGLFPFAPQTDWYGAYVNGYTEDFRGWSGHAAMEERRLPHRISFLRPDGTPAGNAGVNSVILIWRPNPGYIGAWQPAVRYWSYR